MSGNADLTWSFSLSGVASRLGRASGGGLDAFAFVLPAVSFLEITIVGRLIFTEILLLAMLPWLWRSPDRPLIPRWFLVVWAGWLLSQILSDLAVGSAFADYARGWAGIVFTLTNFVAILILVSTPKRARLFAMGLAVAGLLGYVLAPHPAAAGDPWKWAFALPVGLVLAAGLSGRLGARSPWVTIAAFVVFGVLNLILGYRSLGGVSLLAAGYLSLSAVVSRRHTAVGHSRRRAVLGLFFLTAVGLGVLGLYSVAASQGLLGREAQVRYFDQAGAFGALLGGRTEALVSSQAILDSPILGHGSWAKDPKYAALLRQRLEALGYEIPPQYVGADLIPTHSYVLGAWVWAGFLGAVFWLAVAGVAVWLLANLYAFRLEVAPLLVFSTLLLLWDIAFSPYGFVGRITAPYALVLCLLGFRLVRETRDEPVSSDGRERVNREDHPSQERATGNSPRVSVIVPSYNSGAYLREALASALGQVPRPHEVVVQDAGSTDETIAILESFGKRVKWVSASDSGQSDALNRALARTTGDVVVWLNADDLILPGALAAAAAAFEADPTLAFAYGDFDIVDSRGGLIRKYHSRPYSWSRIFAEGCYIFSGSLFVRRPALLAIGGFDVTLRACMDLDLMLRLDAAGKSRHLGRTIAQLRMHETNKSSTMLALFFREAFRVRRRYARGSIRLWLIAIRSTAIHVAALVTTPLRYSKRWPRHGRTKTL